MVTHMVGGKTWEKISHAMNIAILDIPYCYQAVCGICFQLRIFPMQLSHLPENLSKKGWVWKHRDKSEKY